MMNPTHCIGYSALALALAGGLAAGCGDSGETAGPADIRPSLSPASLGQMYPLGDHDADPTGNLRTPYEWVLLLQNTGGAELTIDDVCLVGADPADTDAFTLEVEGQTTPTGVGPANDLAARLTYNRQEPAEIDQVAVVVQSNAQNFPTLIVPVCAQVISDDDERQALECQSPVTVPAGQADETLCQ